MGVLYVVDPVSGNDTYSGTEERPFKTIAHALAQSDVGAGTVIRVLDDTTTNEAITWTKSGAAGNPIHIVRSGNGTNRPKINGELNGQTFIFSACAYVVLDGFDVYGGRNGIGFTGCHDCEVVNCDVHDPNQDAGAPNSTGWCFTGAGSDTYNNGIRRCVVHDSLNDGLSSGEAHGWLIEDCYFHTIGDQVTPADTFNTDGIAFHGSRLTPTIVRRCKFEAIRGKAAISTFSPGAWVFVDSCYIIDCLRTGILADEADVTVTVTNTIVVLPDQIEVDPIAQGVVGMSSILGAQMFVFNSVVINGWIGDNAGGYGGAVSFVCAAALLGVFNSVSYCTTTKGAHFFGDGIGAIISDYNCLYPDDTTVSRPDGRFALAVTFERFVDWQGEPVIPVLDANSIIVDPDFINVSGAGSDTRNLYPKSTSPLLTAGLNVTSVLESAGAVTTDYNQRQRPVDGNWTIGVYEYIPNPTMGSSLLRTNRVGAGITFGVTGTTRLGISFSDSFKDLVIGESFVPGIIGYRVYDAEDSDNPPVDFTYVPALGTIQFSGELDSATNYACDIEVARLATVVRADRSVPLATERYHESVQNPDATGSVGKFIEISSIMASTGASITSIGYVKPKLDFVVIGDDLLERTAELGGKNTTNGCGFVSKNGWKDNYLTKAINAIMDWADTPRRAKILSLTDGSFSITDLSFPRSIGTTLYASESSYKAGVGVNPITNTDVVTEPFWSYPGSVVDYVTKLTSTTDVGFFKPKAVFICLGLKDQEYADAYDKTWTTAARTSLVALVSEIRTQWPDAIICFVQPHNDGPTGRSLAGLPGVDLVDDVIETAVADLAASPYNISVGDMFVLSLKDKIDSLTDFGDVGTILSIDQHTALSVPVAEALKVFLADLSF